MNTRVVICANQLFARRGGNYIKRLKGFGIAYEWIRVSSGKICVTLNQLSIYAMVTYISFYLSKYSFFDVQKFLCLLGIT